MAQPAQYPPAPGAASPSRLRRSRISRKRERSVVPGPVRASVLLWLFSSSTSDAIRAHVVPFPSASVSVAT
jgi:hypothetical protein